MNKEEFIKDANNNWTSYVHLLWASLEATKHLGLPVLELGAGYGSTPILRQYCRDNKLKLFSYDSKKEWAEKMGVNYVEDWDSKAFWHLDFGVAFLDHAPGEHRKIALGKLHHCRIILAHDTEPAADHGYKMRAELAKYKYQIDYKTDGAWATAVSDYIDITKLKL